MPVLLKSFRNWCCKHWRRLALFVGLLLCSSLLVIGPWWHSWVSLVDPPEDVFRRGVKRIQKTAWMLPLTKGPFRAGAAAVEIRVQDRNIGLGGYGRRALLEGNTGTADPIFARAIVIESRGQKLCLLTADLLLINRFLIDEMLSKLQGWNRRQFYFGASHTHSGPAGFPGSVAEIAGLGFQNPKAIKSIVGALAEAVVKAEKQLKPAELKVASLEGEANWIRNRTVHTDPENRWLDALFLREKESEEPIASLVVFGAHATCRSSHDNLVSGDYAGVLARKVEEISGGVCLFFAGGVGSMGPPDDAVPREQLSDWLGEKLAEATQSLSASKGDFEREPTLGMLTVQVPLPPPNVRLSSKLSLSPIAGSLLLHKRAWISGVRMGEMTLLSTPADYSGELALQLRQSEMTAVVTSFSGDYVGYILPDRYYRIDAYESGMCFYGEHLGSGFQQYLEALHRRLTQMPSAEGSSGTTQPPKPK